MKNKYTFLFLGTRTRRTVPNCEKYFNNSLSKNPKGICLITIAFELPSGSVPGLQGNTFSSKFLTSLFSAIFVKALKKRHTKPNDYISSRTRFVINIRKIRPDKVIQQEYRTSHHVLNIAYTSWIYLS